MRTLIFFILCPFFSSTQTIITADEFFAKGLNEQFSPAMLSESGTVKFPIIEEYELRTETRDFDINKQEYTFRVSPSTPEKRRAQEALYEHYRNLPDFQAQEDYCEKLHDIHIDWLGLFILNQQRLLLVRLRDVLNDKQTVFEKLAGTLDFNYEKLLKLEVDKSDLDLAIKQSDLDRDYIVQKYGIQGIQIDFGPFRTTDEISAELIISVDSPFIPTDPEAVYEKELIDKELALEMAEGKQIFDFAQLRYRGPHTDFLDERLSLGIGLRLPNSGNRKLKIQELQLQRAEIQRDEKRRSKNRRNDMIEIADKLLKDIQAFEQYQIIFISEREKLIVLGEQLSQEEGYSPLFKLDIETRHLSNELDLLELQEDIFNDYLKYLEDSGKMCTGQVVNHLD